MSRKPRKYGDTGIYHVILRGNNKQNLFYDDNDRFFFINRLIKYVDKSGIDLYAYCLMGNHVHLLIGKGNYVMSDFIKRLSCSYVYYFNHKYERTGHLFQGRYKSEPVETVDYFKTVYRYILKNPEKAGLCIWSSYRWSSINCSYVTNESINKCFLYEVFGDKTNVINFLNQHNNDICMDYDSSELKNYYDDELIILFIKQLFDNKNFVDIFICDSDKLKEKLRILKIIGISINQLSRITGIEKEIIKNA